MSLWDRVRETLIAVWADVPRPRGDERTALLAWLCDTYTVEQRMSSQIYHDATAMPYELFRRRLESMAREEEKHARVLRERIEALGGRVPETAPTLRKGQHPWMCLVQMLADERELYEGYRQQAAAVHDADLQALLQQLRNEEEIHQEQIIDLLMKVDGHIS